VLVALMVMAASVGVGAQAVDQGDELKRQEQLVDELRFRRAQVVGLEGLVKAQGEQIKTLSELAATLRERGDFYKEATQARAGANVIEAERERMRREQLEEYRAEVARLREENDKLSRSRDLRMVVGAAAGVGLGVMLRR
jgi:hypothetical protein